MTEVTVITDPLGYRRLDPLPDPEQVARYYADNDAFYLDSAPWFEKERQEHQQGLWQAAYDWQLSKLTPYGASYRLVDLGAGSGYFVQFWNHWFGRDCAVGVEPSRTARSWSPCPGRMEASLSLAAKRFHQGAKVYLRAALLLEHLPDPAWYLKEAVRYFPGTQAVLVIVPNDYNPLQLRLNRRVSRDKQFWWIADYHCNYFDPAGLRAVMEAAGLQVVYEGVTCPLELFGLAGLNYIGNDALGKKIHRLRLRFEQMAGGRAFGLYDWLYHRYGWGRELVFVGIPK